MNEPGSDETIFAAALEQPPAERAAFLKGACLGDAALRGRVESLLAAHDATANPLLTPLDPNHPTLPFSPPPDETVGQTIGRYKLLEKLGEGGCGVVYVAEQTEPVRRRVALKVIKLGMDTRQVVVRFEAERQALAMMDHPNIAKVLDAGTTGQGRPFFVMELVRGIRITDYCDQANLSTNDRLELFIKVCQAIQHAHQKGIIHRDIKPSNILVTLHDGVPVPKVIDFGIAKATEGRLTDATVYTQLHQFIGTPAYMSPEQAEMSGLDIDTRSDIYSLGVLLYELLAGSTPFDAKDLMSLGIDAMRKTIREKEPPRPSTRLATLGADQLTTTAKRRSADTSKLLHQLKGDLDWIVMKCLEKDRQRRYETANGLAADLKRHLNNEPVVARPPSAAYKFQKAWRRNKVVFTAGAVVVIALVAGIAASVWQARVASFEKAKAVLAGDQARNSETQKEIERQKAADERDRAEQARLAARRHAYASDMNLAQAALEANNLGRALSLLDRHRPGDKAELDLRGWEWRYLWGQCRSDEQAVVWQGTNDIRDLSVSHDGKWVAIAEEAPGELSILDAKTYRPIGPPLPVGDGSRFMTFSPTEPLLAFSHAQIIEDGRRKYSVRLWDGRSRQVVQHLPLEDECAGLRFSSDGSRLVTLSVAGAKSVSHLQIWRVPEGVRVTHHQVQGDATSGGLADNFAVTGDLSLAAFGNEPGYVRVIDLSTGQERWSAKAGEEVVLSVAFSPDGSILATGPGYADRTIRLWDTRTARELAQLKGHDSLVLALHFSPDGKTLASASGDQTIRLWDVSDLSKVPESRVLRGHQRQVWRVRLHPDQRTLLSASQDKSVRAWDASAVGDERTVRMLSPSTPGAFRFAPDGSSVFTVDASGKVAQWHGPAFRKSEVMAMDLGPDFQVAQAMLSKDCRYSAVSSADGRIQIFDLGRRARVATFNSGLPGVRLFAFLPRDNSLLLGDVDGMQVFLWNLQTQARGESWPVAPGFDWSHTDDYLVYISSDQSFFFTAGWNGQAVLRNLITGQEFRRDLHTTHILKSSFSNSGKTLAACTLNGTIHLLETKSLQSQEVLGQLRLSINGAAFSEDDQRVVGVSTGTEAVRIWDRSTLRDLLTLPTDGLLIQVAFSPGERFLGANDTHGRIHIWRAPSWEEIAAAEAKEKAENKQP